jgi:hypothetical protein
MAMNKIWLGLIFITLISFSHALEVVDLDPNAGNNPANQQNQTTTQNQQQLELQLITRIASLENKVENLPTRQDIVDVTNQQYEAEFIFLRDKTDIILLASAMLHIFTLVLGFALYAYLKAKRRL